MLNINLLVQQSFLTLVGLGIETIKSDAVEKESFSNLSQENWCDIKKMADKQGVSAIVFDGLCQLMDSFGKKQVAPNIDNIWWQQFVLEWMSMMSVIEHRNRQQLAVINDLASYWTEKGCKVLVFKGQTSATMYPKPAHRSPGDIDCYLFEDYALGNEIAREVGADVNENWYKHSSIRYKGETFENHHFFAHTRDGKKGKTLEKELERELISNSQKCSKLTETTLKPPLQWIAMFLTYHACGHFVTEGLRMKQLLDWALFLQKYQDDVDWRNFYSFCDRNHLRRFADAATSICVEHLGINISNSIITVESPFSEKLLNSTLYDDDYVFNSGEGSWRNRFHLVSNLFRYRWKYEEICQESIWRQLWYDVSGYLFHTE